MSDRRLPKDRPYRTINTDPSLTRQSEARACDVKYIVEQAQRGAIQLLNPGGREPVYADERDIPTFRESLDQVRRVTTWFEGLDVKVRKQFDYSPESLLTWLDDPQNHAEAVKLGLMAPPVETEKDVARRRRRIERELDNDPEFKVVPSEKEAGSPGSSPPAPSSF